MKEHLRVSKEILARLPKQVQKSDESSQKFVEAKIPDHKEPEKKIGGEKRKDIMIGSWSGIIFNPIKKQRPKYVMSLWIIKICALLPRSINWWTKNQ